MTRIAKLSTGADVRLHNERGTAAVVLVNGGTARSVPGTWSATSELLTNELAPRFPDLAFAEVRYRIKTWNALDSCIADARAALDLVARPSLLVGFSMGGAVSIAVAGHPAVGAVLGLAPWIPERMSLDGLRGKRFDVLHGAWDRYLPGIPGVSPASSLKGFERAERLGIEGTYRLIPRGLHGAAVRRGAGGIVRLPRAEAWVAGVGERLELFQGTAIAADTGRSAPGA
jgi:pimeloyl-ACP methyl ester carboxylesterase